jgi:flagellar hook-associated protein 1 FlgK
MTIMNNALSGALAAQVALATTSQNIANLQTKGYTRQGALLVARGGNGPRAPGEGVEVPSLLRFSDGYKSQQMWRAASNLGAYTQSQPYLTQLERVMGDDSASLSSGIDKFFAALNAVAGVDPTSTPLYGQVVTNAGLLAQRVNSLNNVFVSQLQSVAQQRAAIVDSANSKIQAIAVLNQKISYANSTGASASALIDERDNAIDALASHMALEVSDQPDGTRNVSLATGQALVIGSMAGTLKAAGGSGVPQTFTLNFAGTDYGLDAAALGGQLGGLTTYEQNVLLPLQKNVATIAEQIATRVNAQLRAGLKMDGTPGVDMFVFNAGSSSNMLSIATNFQATDLAFADVPTPPDPPEPGNTGNLLKIIAIKDQTISFPPPFGNMLLGDADTQLVGKLGVDSQQNRSGMNTAQTVRNQAVQDWQSTSGVNEDEEAVNLVEYQKMYQANMKVMSVANALFDATLAMMG